MKNPQNQTAFAPSLTAKELTTQFISNRRASRKYSGESNTDCLEALAYSAGVLSINREPFDQNKFLSLTRSFVDSAESTHNLLVLFGEWVNFLIQHKKLTRDAFWIDLPIYRFV